MPGSYDVTLLDQVRTHWQAPLVKPENQPDSEAEMPRSVARSSASEGLRGEFHWHCASAVERSFRESSESTTRTPAAIAKPAMGIWYWIARVGPKESESCSQDMTAGVTY